MTGATLFSGIGAPETADPSIDWKFCAEIEQFPCEVIALRHPQTVNLGNVTDAHFIKKARSHGPIDVLVFGSPCQSFSVAGKRLGLDDPRGNLALIALGIVAELNPRWFLFENVPGLLSSDNGRDFGVFLGAVEKCGYQGAWRILDAQYWGLAQRRERLFFVGHRGEAGWRAAFAVLFERESLRRHIAESPETGQDVAGTIGNNSGAGCNDPARAGAYVQILEVGARQGTKDDPRDGLGIGKPGDPMFTLTNKQHGIAFGGNNTSGPIDVATAVNAKGGSGRSDFESETFIAHTLRADGLASEDGTGRGSPLICFDAKQSGADAGMLAPTLRATPHDKSHANGGGGVAICVQDSQSGVRLHETAGSMRADAPGSQAGGSLVFNARQDPISSELAQPLDTDGFSQATNHGQAVRRLTPLEWARLQGFEDFYVHIERKKSRTIKPDERAYLEYHGLPVFQDKRGRWRTHIAADGPMYKALGNSMPVPVVRWILERLQAVDKILEGVGEY